MTTKTTPQNISPITQHSQTHSQPATASTSYANKVKTKISPLADFTHPKEDQGIVFNCILDFKFRDYLIAIKDKVGGPTNMIAGSKVSNNRIIIFLKDSEMVNAFMSEHAGFTIESHFIPCRRLKSGTKKNNLLKRFSYNTQRSSRTPHYKRIKNQNPL